MSRSLPPLFFFALLIAISTSHALPKNSAELQVISSSNPQSRAAHSFVIVPAGQLIPSGIKKESAKSVLALQIPFIVKFKNKLDKSKQLQWSINIPNNKFGSIQLFSKFKGKHIKTDEGTLWQSELLNNNTHERHQLVFRPKPPRHKPFMYKKGRGSSNQRQKYGGGTRNINDKPYNPRFKYEITLNIFEGKKKYKAYQTVIEIDNKDMIRQEYINHYNIKRYGRGGNGTIPVPERSEISTMPEKIKNLAGNPLTESEYKLLINDGMFELAKNIVEIYETSKQFHKQNPIRDRNGKILLIPNSKLWLSGGWRNPERNEWYSNALNGMHQRGGAIDLIITDPPGDINTAIAYWILWKGLQRNKDKLNAYWQLETGGRPMRTDEFENDITPKNGIPDAFDKADHLHANIKYKAK